MTDRKILERYLQGNCTPEEAAQVEAWLKEEAAKEGEAWTPVENGKNLDPQISERMYAVIRNKTSGNRNGKLIGMAKWITAAAACIAFIIWLPFGKNDGSAPAAPVAANAVPQERVELNNGESTRDVVLPDGSKVLLYPGSVIRFSAGLDTMQERRIILMGKAGFEVVSDKKHPFRVTSDVLNTTATGTRFTVMAYPREPVMIVQLEEGVVNVNTEARSVDERLKPGEQLVYTKQSGLAVVSRMKTTEALAGAKPSRPDEEPSKPDWFRFSGQPLPAVLEQLSIFYNVPIQYKREELQHAYFAGRYQRTDSLVRLLNDIALLNELELIPLEKGYELRKKKP